MKYNCYLCKTIDVDCFSACDKCSIGLCSICFIDYNKKLSQLTREYIMKCNICKTNFYDFCDFCHNQTLTYMIQDKIDILYENLMCSNCQVDDELVRCKSCEEKYNNEKETINNYRNLLFNQEKKYDVVKHLIGSLLGISDISLYECGLDYLYCKDCFIKELNFEPKTQVL